MSQYRFDIHMIHISVIGQTPPRDGHIEYGSFGPGPHLFSQCSGGAISIISGNPGLLNAFGVVSDGGITVDI